MARYTDDELCQCVCLHKEEFFKYANWQTNAGKDEDDDDYDYGNDDGNNLQLPGLEWGPEPPPELLPPKPETATKLHAPLMALNESERPAKAVSHVNKD